MDTELTPTERRALGMAVQHRLPELARIRDATQNDAVRGFAGAQVEALTSAAAKLELSI